VSRPVERSHAPSPRTDECDDESRPFFPETSPVRSHDNAAPAVKTPNMLWNLFVPNATCGGDAGPLRRAGERNETSPRRRWNRSIPANTGSDEKNYIDQRLVPVQLLIRRGWHPARTQDSPLQSQGRTSSGCSEYFRFMVVEFPFPPRDHRAGKDRSPSTFTDVRAISINSSTAKITATPSGRKTE
jgi:hypothetical protein